MSSGDARDGMKRIEAVNDFVIKFANVNGSGSASANELFAKAILRMGVPVSPRNIFPSNIQGLPTWYEVRVSEQGYLGRRGGIDMMVAMNPQTWAQDVAEIEPGGYLFYDSTRPLPASAFRDDVNVIGDAAHRDLQRDLRGFAPAPAVQEHHVRRRAVGAARASTRQEIEALFGEQYTGKERLLDSNVRALHGRARVRTRPSRVPIGLRVRRADRVGERIFVDGNIAAALGCVYGGATVAAWYPITPSTSVIEGLPEVLQASTASTGHRAQQLRDRAGRRRDRLDRHGHRRRLERRARVHRDLGAGHLADDGVHRPRVLRRDSGRRSSTCSAAGRPPACRRARSRRTCSPAPMRRTATPSTCCCSRRIRPSASSMPPRRSTSPIGCKRRCS